jgi:hypothetical protein
MAFGSAAADSRATTRPRSAAESKYDWGGGKWQDGGPIELKSASNPVDGCLSTLSYAWTIYKSRDCPSIPFVALLPDQHPLLSFTELLCHCDGQYWYERRRGFHHRAWWQREITKAEFEAQQPAAASDEDAHCASALGWQALKGIRVEEDWAVAHRRAEADEGRKRREDWREDDAHAAWAARMR